MKKLALTLVLGITLLSCTDNSRARTFGGTETIKLPPNHVFIGATWKETNLWVLSRDTITNINYFKEKSAFGMVEGQIIFK